MTKVYVVEAGAYSDRRIQAVFTTQEIAEAYVIETTRRGWDPYPPRDFPEPIGRTFEEWSDLADPYGYDVGDVTEYDLWDTVPIADLVPAET